MVPQIHEYAYRTETVCKVLKNIYPECRVSFLVTILVLYVLVSHKHMPGFGNQVSAHSVLNSNGKLSVNQFTNQSLNKSVNQSSMRKIAPFTDYSSITRSLSWDCTFLLSGITAFQSLIFAF